MITFDKDIVKESLSVEQVFHLVQEWGGTPFFMPFGFVATTICHNFPNEGTPKLYYYNNTKLFKCYTECDSSFDIFQLIVKLQNIQKDNDKYTLGHALQYIAYKFNIKGAKEEYKDDDTLADWAFLDSREKIKISIDSEFRQEQLKTYDEKILQRFSYPRIISWIEEGITEEVLKYNKIGFYPVDGQVTIPHYNREGKLVGIRGRFLGNEEALQFGKYRPLLVANTLYNHPLGLNLYNLNNSYLNIKKTGKAILFEGEKSCLLYQSYFGIENDITVACCGSSMSSRHIELLLESGATEIAIAFDKQFKEIGDKEFMNLTKKLIILNNKHKNFALISILFDKKNKLAYKDSPIDKGKETFLELWKQRIIL